MNKQTKNEKTPQKAPVKSKPSIYSSEDDTPSKQNKTNVTTTAKRKAPAAKTKSGAAAPKPKPTILKSGEVINKQNPTRKINDKPHVTTSSDKNKKKSIFSPDNSSDSEDNASPNKSQTKSTNSKTTPGNRTKEKTGATKSKPTATKPKPPAKPSSSTKTTSKAPIPKPRRNSTRTNSKVSTNLVNTLFLIIKLYFKKCM